MFNMFGMVDFPRNFIFNCQYIFINQHDMIIRIIEGQGIEF